jgi:hypothetical protein
VQNENDSLPVKLVTGTFSNRARIFGLPNMRSPPPLPPLFRPHKSLSMSQLAGRFCPLKFLRLPSGEGWPLTRVLQEFSKYGDMTFTTYRYSFTSYRYSFTCDRVRRALVLWLHSAEACPLRRKLGSCPPRNEAWVLPSPNKAWVLPSRKRAL